MRYWYATKLMEANMRRVRNMLWCAIALTTVLSLSGAPAWALGQGAKPKGDVRPCDLSGVNPAYHPGIFGNPAVAKSYGFVQSKDGTWHVSQAWRG
jgi:hypothetical protein